MESIVAEAAQSAVSGAVGSAVSNAVEKGGDAVKPHAIKLAETSSSDVEVKAVKVGIKATEIVLSSVVTASAIAVFTRASKLAPGRVATVALSLTVSVAAAILAAFLKVAI